MEPKDGAFYFKDEVSEHGLVLLVQLSWRVAPPWRFILTLNIFTLSSILQLCSFSMWYNSSVVDDNFLEHMLHCWSTCFVLVCFCNVAGISLYSPQEFPRAVPSGTPSTSCWYFPVLLLLSRYRLSTVVYTLTQCSTLYYNTVQEDALLIP